MNKSKFSTIVLISFFCLCIFSGCSRTSIAVWDGVLRNDTGDSIIKINAVPTLEYDFIADSIDGLYATRVLHNTTLTSDTSINDRVIYVTDTTDCVIGDALNIYDENYFSQVLIQAVGTNNITINAPMDIEFSTLNTIVECADWTINEDGSTTPVVYTLQPPSNATWHINTIVYSFQDDSPMDSGTFGSLPTLTNGLIVRTYDGYVRNLINVVNNKGFDERNCPIIYDDKAPAGTYGAKCTKYFKTSTGTVIELVGSTGDRFEVIVQDDLTAQDLFAVTGLGHYKFE